MVSESHTAVLTRFYEALNGGDVGAAIGLCDREVEVYLAPNLISAVAPRGHRDVEAWLRSFLDSWHMYRPEPEDFVDAGEKVVALVHLRARGKGSRFEIEEEVADVFEVDDGKISKLRLYVHRETAFEQAKGE
jgi:ketosteroid isomerase-like protein